MELHILLVLTLGLPQVSEIIMKIMMLIMIMIMMIKIMMITIMMIMIMMMMIMMMMIMMKMMIKEKSPRSCQVQGRQRAPHRLSPGLQVESRIL